MDTRKLVTCVIVAGSIASTLQAQSSSPSPQPMSEIGQQVAALRHQRRAETQRLKTEIAHVREEHLKKIAALEQECGAAMRPPPQIEKSEPDGTSSVSTSNDCRKRFLALQKEFQEKVQSLQAELHESIQKYVVESAKLSQGRGGRTAKGK